MRPLINDGFTFDFKRHVFLLRSLLESLDLVLGVLDLHLHVSLFHLLLVKLICYLVEFGFVLVQILDQVDLLLLQLEQVVLHSLSVVLR